MLPPLPARVPLATAIPSVVVIVMAARCVPVPFEVASGLPVRLDPVRGGERWPRPIAIVPEPASVAWIPVALNPLILRAGLRRDPIDARWRRWRAEGKTERNL